MSVKKRIRKNKSKTSEKKRRTASGVFFPGLVRHFFGFIGFISLSVLFILGHDIMTQGNLFAAKQILVAGNRQLSESRVLELAGIQPGTNIFAVNLSMARKRLLSDGWVADARIGREIPDQLVVKIREHEPLAYIDLEKKYVMSREGTIIKEWDERDLSVLPLITGLDYSDLPLGGSRSEEPFASLLSVLSVAHQANGALSLDQLGRIDVDRDLGLTLHASGPVKKVRIGFGGYAEKFKRVDRLLDHLDLQFQGSGLEIIELESDSRIVAGPFLKATFDTTTRRS